MSRPYAAMCLAADHGVATWWPSSARSQTDGRTTEFWFDAERLAAGDESTLTPALQELARASAARVLHVALTSPWSTARVVPLPSLRATEASRVLQRDASHHFPLLRAEPVVAAHALDPRSWLASDADDLVLEAIGRAARASGFLQVCIRPAVAAWGKLSGGTGERAFVVAGEATVLRVQSGRITGIRRCRAADLSTQVPASKDALVLAAQYAPLAEALELLSARARVTRDEHARRRVRQLVIAGMAMLCLAVAVHAWGVHRRLTRMVAHRAAIEPRVSPLRATRDSLTRINDALAAIARSRESAPTWGVRLVALASALPSGTHYERMQGAGDSVRVEGRAPNASMVIDQLRHARDVRRVQALSTPLADDGAMPFAAIVWFGDRRSP